MPKNNLDVRIKLGRKLLVPTDGIIEKRDKDDNRSVLKSLPKKGMKAIVIHRKLEIRESVIAETNLDNCAVEVTLIGDNCDPYLEYDEVLFTPDVIYHWITKSPNRNVHHLL